ncbi:MAG: hypothetical protein HN350_01935 [Phycisphaerales bacterium]|nr:hypothetical protein [Phycisphaerales bacterium]
MQIGVASVCGLVVAVAVMGFMLGWFTDRPPELSQDVLNPKAAPPTAGVKELLGKLDRIAQAAGNPEAMRQKQKELTWKIHAAFGDIANAIVTRGSDGNTEKMEVLMYALESARRRGDKAVSDKAADNMYALALLVNDDSDGKVDADLKHTFLLAAAGGYAMAGNVDRFKEIMDGLKFSEKQTVKRDRFLGRTASVLKDVGDPVSQWAVLGRMSAKSYMSERLDVANAISAGSDKAAASKCFQACLNRMLADSKAGRSTRLLRKCLVDMCEAGMFDDASEGVIALPLSHSDRSDLLGAVTMSQAASGDADGAVKNARRGGDLLLAAELALKAGKKQQAADDALHVYGVLPVLPKQQPSSRRPTREVSASSGRVALLRRIALVLLKADKERQGRIVLDQAHKIVSQGTGREFDRLMYILTSAEIEVIEHHLASGNIDAAQRTLELAKTMPRSDACLPKMYTSIGVAMWKNGDKTAAEAAFDKAVAAQQNRMLHSGFLTIAAARAKAGDVDGAVKTLALRKSGHPSDSELGDMAVAQIHAGDPKGALETITAVRMYGFRYTNILRRITDAVAERGDLEGAFRMFQVNARTVGARLPEPTELAIRAIDTDKGELLQKYYRPIRSQSLAMVVTRAVDSGKTELAQAILERGLEHLVGVNDVISTRHEIMSTVSLMAEHGDKAKALQALRAIMSQPDRDKRRALQIVPLTVDVMLKVGSLDDVLVWAAKISDPRHRAAILQTASDILVGSVLLPQDRSRRLAVLDQNVASPPTVSEIQRIFGREQPRGRDGRSFPGRPPHIPPGSKRPRVKLVAVEAVTGTWTVQRILANARRTRNSGPSDCAVCVKDGAPMVFFFDTDSGHGGWSVIRAYKSGGAWRREEFASPNKQYSYGWLDASVVAGVPHVAMNLTEIGSKRAGGLEIRALRDGKWTTVFEKRNVGAHYGRRVAIGDLSGRVVAVYTDVYPKSGGHSHHAKFLEHGVDGEWAEMRLPLPYVAGLTGFDIGQVGKDVALAFSTSGASGKYTASRAEGKWTFDRVNKLTEGQAYLFELNGKVASLSSGGYEKRKIIFNTSDKLPQPIAVLPSDFNPNLVDATTIGSRPAMITYDRKSNKMFYLEFTSAGKWVASEVTIGQPFRQVAKLRLFEIAGKPAAVYFESSSRGADLFLVQPR